MGMDRSTQRSLSDKTLRSVMEKQIKYLDAKEDYEVLNSKYTKLMITGDCSKNKAKEFEKRLSDLKNQMKKAREEWKEEEKKSNVEGVQRRNNDKKKKSQISNFSY